MITSWPSKTYQKRKKHQKRRSEFKNAQQRRSGAGIEEQKKNKEISKLQDIIEHHKNIISKGRAKNKEARKKMLDRIKQYEQRVLDLSNTKHKEKLSEKKVNDMLAK